MDDTELRNMACEMHDDILDHLITSSKDGHKTAEACLAFLGAVPLLVGRCLLIFDNPMRKKAAIHELVHNILEQSHEAQQNFDDFINQEGKE